MSPHLFPSLREDRPTPSLCLAGLSRKDALSKDIEQLRKKYETMAQQLQRTKEELQKKEKEAALFALERDQLSEDFKRRIREKDEVISRMSNGSS